MQFHLGWNISLNHDFVIKPIFHGFFSINESPFETEFSLKNDLITKPIFYDFFNINESPFETAFNLNHDLITEPIFCDLVLQTNIIFCLGIKSVMT